MDPVTAYVSASTPWATDFGDQVFEATGCPNVGHLPVGWSAVVETLPTHGTVELSTPAAYGWRYTANAGAPVGSDSWVLKVTDPAAAVTRLTVPMELAPID